jgi:SAM-dependent methyltransferase
MSYCIPGLCRLHAWRRRQEFVLGPFAWLVNPFVFARRGLWRELRPLLAELSGEVLDVGCGRKPYRAFVPAERYIGLDIDLPATRALGVADVLYDGRRFPLPDASFDAVLCSQVFEHVFNPEEFLGEIRRVLRPHGRLILTVPFVWDEHEQPHDFARYSSFGLKALLEHNGFEVEVQRRSVADSRVLFQLAAAYVYKVTETRSKWLRLFVQLTLIAPITLAGVVLGCVLPGNPDLYLDNIVVAHRASLP